MYTLRINGSEFRAQVFKAGAYTIRIGEGPGRRTLENVQSIANDDGSAIDARL